MNINLFIDSLSAIHPLSCECREFLIQHTREEIYTKHQVILSAGQIANRLWFMEKGFAMEYYYRDEDKKPYRFWNEREIIVDVSSFFRQIPAEGYIEMLETSRLLALDYAQLQSMFHQFPEAHVIARTIVENYHYEAERKTVDLLTLSPAERYRQLLETSPFILQKTSIENVAAYLGISRKTLNRVRSGKRMRERS